MNTFLGIDGGGSKTDFLLIDDSGTVLATRRAGSAYHLETGIDTLQAMLNEGIRAILAEGALAATDLTFACLGIPAYGEDEALLARLDAIATPTLPAGRYRCVNDMVCGWAGALAASDGINIVAGTGSIGYGEFAGKQARAGGWGELFGDEGSAYWVAREALALFARMSDGRMERGPLYEQLRAHFALRNDLDLCAVVYGPPALSRTAIAALAPLVARAARTGDLAAQGLFRAAAGELAAIVDAVRAGLGVPRDTTLPVSFSGGLFHVEDWIRAPLAAALGEGGRRYDVRQPRLSPRAGAALYAAQLAGRALSATAVARLAKMTSAASAGDLAS